MLNSRQLSILNDIFHSSIKPILKENEENLNKFIKKGENIMTTFTDAEKQLILYAKGFFYRVWADRVCILRTLTSYAYNLEENVVTYNNMESFIVKTFLKLKSNQFIQLEEKDMLIELLQGDFDHQIECYISWIQSSNFENNDIDLGEPNLSLFE